MSFRVLSRARNRIGCFYFVLSALVILSPTPLAAASTAEIEMVQSRWGFDGHVLPGHFNLLSVTLANRSQVPFEGELVLEETVGLNHRTGAPLMEPLYLGPNSQRSIQFHPFILRENGWHLRWGKRPKEHVEITEPKFGGPARVLLADPEALPKKTRLKTFPDDLFPTHAAVADALDAVVLDHVPRWESARRRAFADWVRDGGVVHLAIESAVEPLRFSGDLDWLNAPVETIHFGAGRVVRHPLDITRIDENVLATHGSPARELRRGNKVVLFTFDAALLRKLAAVTQPGIGWKSLYVLSAIYILVIGPGLWACGRRCDYRFVIAAFVAVVVLASAVFHTSARRGAHESQSAYSLALAHALEPRRHLVTQWTSAFVARGGTYHLTHAAEANFYSGASETDSINGVIRNGREGSFAVDIPISSTRPFVHRAVLPGDDCTVTVHEWSVDANGNLAAVTLEPSAAFPKEVSEIWLRHRDRIQRLTEKDRRLRFSQNPLTLSDFFMEPTWVASFSQPNDRTMADLPVAERQSWMKQMARPLILRALGGGEQMDRVVEPRPLDTDVAQLFVLARAPKTFHMRPDVFKTQDGWVLYQQEVFKP